MPSAVTSGDDVKGERDLSRTMSFSQSSDDSQTAAEYVYILRLWPFQCCRRIWLTWMASFIDSQLKLEADAREALPYVRHGSSPSTSSSNICIVEIRYMHKAFGPSSPASVRLYHLQPSSGLIFRTLHACGGLLLLLSSMSWRTYTGRALQQAKLCMRLWNYSNTINITMYTAVKPHNKPERWRSFRASGAEQQVQSQLPESLLWLRLRLRCASTEGHDVPVSWTWYC